MSAGERMAGYSGTPLARKLGIGPGTRVLLDGAPGHLRALLEPLPQDVVFTRKVSPQVRIVHLFVTRKSDLARSLKAYRTRLPVDAAVWVSWPKKAAKVATDITEETIREVALPLGWVDIKVCAIDATWSGLKLMLRRELR
jgi:hypothetical protein